MILRALLYNLFKKNPGQHADTRPTDNVDLSQYLGRWYELARYDTAFEEGLEEVYTEYKARPDGSISVNNFGMDKHHHRKEAHAVGTPSGDGQMMVSFVPFMPFLSTPYNILAVDEFYRNALVSNDSGSCLWFLSRSPQPEEESFDALKSEALRRGFDLSALHYTKHRFVPPREA